MQTVEIATGADWPKISEISGRSRYEDYINRIGPSYLDNGQVLVWKDETDIRGFLKLEYLPDTSAWLSGLRTPRISMVYFLPRTESNGMEGSMQVCMPS